MKNGKKSYGGEGDNIAYSVMQDVDGGYLIAGVTRSNGDFDGDGFLMKTDTDGNQIWYKTYGCLLYTSPSPRDLDLSRMPSSA